jgi:hypothetical protein
MSGENCIPKEGSDDDNDDHPNESFWDRLNYLWRGHLISCKSKTSKYEGKGQRFDSFLLPTTAMGQVECCDTLGDGRLREGLFCASDHCAVSLTLMEP